MSIVLDGKRHEVKERLEGGFIRREEKTTAMVRVSHINNPNVPLAPP